VLNAHFGAEPAPRSGTLSLRAFTRTAQFDELALPLFDSIYNFAYWLSGSRSDAEDLVQETYLKALRGFATFQPGTNFRAWIFRILRNTFLSTRASAYHRQAAQFLAEDAVEELPSRFADPVAVLTVRARLAAVETAMLRLPAVYREVLVLCDLEEASYRETAERLSIPIGTVMSRLARARRSVREAIGG
jgi:RNA polymerase sigma-70 factor, ECF subfamily